MDFQAIADPLLDLLEADTVLQGILGSGASMALYYAGERDFQVPSMEWHVVTDAHDEQMGDVIVQVDYFARSLADIATMQSQVQKHWDEPLGRTLGGVYIESSFEGGGPLPGADDGVFGRFNTFRHSTVRERYR